MAGEARQPISSLAQLKRAALFVLFALALLIPKTLGLFKRLRPGRPAKPVDEQARELGALVVLNGGWFQGARARLFVGPGRVHVLDFKHRPLAEIPLSKVSSVRLEENQARGWRLMVEWSQDRAEFHYGGFFAEHLAEVAATTLRNQMRRQLPVISR